MKTIVHALFVGINKYEANVIVDRMATFPALGGCVNDVVDVRNLLAADPSIDLQAITLADRDATKDNIVHAFEEKLSQAGPDDVVLFYYSGHGTVEKADPNIWTAESDGRLEGIVCYYTGNESGKFLLSDKELRYLLAELYEKTKAHIVTIFDCCHSGDNTRAAFVEPVIKKHPTFRGEFLTFPQRKWENFVFAKKYQPEFFKGKGIDEALPPGRYVQLSACESNEPALETRGHGVLTAHLLNALKETGGNISYRDLASRIRNQVKYLFEQRPRIYAPNDAEDIKDTGFLKKPVGAMVTQAQLIYNSSGKYLLDRGMLHHVEPGVTTVTTTGKDGQPVTGTVSSAELDSAIVAFTQAGLGNLVRTNPPTVQAATLSNLSNRVLRIHLLNEDLADQPFKLLLDVLSQPDNAAYFTFEDDGDRADYTLVFWKGMAYFIRAGKAAQPNDLYRPLVLPVKTKSANAGEKLVRQLRHISQWKFVEGLRNQGENALSASTLKVEFFEVNADGVETPLAAEENGTVRPKLTQRPNLNAPGQRWATRLKVKITNQSNSDLYVAAPYCSYDFSCDTTALLNPPVTMLTQGESKWLRDHKNSVINFKLNDTVRIFNWSESRETLKLMFSTVPFENIGALELDALPAPTEMRATRKGSMDDGEDQIGQNLQGWNAFNFQIVLANPRFNRVHKDVLRSVSTADTVNTEEGDVDLNNFMSELYFDKKEGGNGELALKNGVVAED